MRIAQCIATKTALIDNRVIDFNPEVTVITGGNDSGKTLIVKGVADTLFTLCGGESLLPDQLWDGLYFNATVAINDQRYRVIREGLTRVSVTLLEGKESLEIAGTPGSTELTDELTSRFPSLAASLAGLTPRLFADFAYLPSPLDSHTPPEFSFAAIAPFLLNDASGISETASSLAGLLGGISGRMRNPIHGEIISHETAIRELEKDLSILEVHSSKLEKLSAEKAGLERQNRIMELDRAKLENRRSELLLAEEALSAIFIDQSRIAGLERSISEDRSRHAEAEALRRRIDSAYKRFTGMSQEMRNALNLVQSAYRRAIDAKDLFEKRRKRLRSTDIIHAAAWLLPLTLAFGFIFWADAVIPVELPWALRFAPLAGLSIPAAVSFLVRRRRMQHDVVHRLRAAYEDAVRELENTFASAGIMPPAGSFDELFEFLIQYFEEYADYTGEESDYEALLDTFATPERIAELEQEIAQLKESRAARLKILAGIQGDRDQESLMKTPVSRLLEETDTAIRTLDSERERNLEILQQIEDEINARSRENGAATQIDTSLAYHRERLAALQKINATAAFIAGTMESAKSSRTEKLADSVRATAEELFRDIMGTDTPADFSALIHGNPQAVRNPAIRMVALLSLKLALTDRLDAMNRMLPLIIDEPTSYLDRTRIANIAGVLRNFAPRRQIILTSCDPDSFSALGSRVAI